MPVRDMLWFQIYKDNFFFGKLIIFFQNANKYWIYFLKGIVCKTTQILLIWTLNCIFVVGYNHNIKIVFIYMKKIKKHDDKSVHLKLVYQYSHTLFLPPHPAPKKMWKEIRPPLFKKNRTLFEVDSDTVVVWLDLDQWGKKKINIGYYER